MTGLTRKRAACALLLGGWITTGLVWSQVQDDLESEVVEEAEATSDSEPAKSDRSSADVIIEKENVDIGRAGDDVLRFVPGSVRQLAALAACDLALTDQQDLHGLVCIR